MARALIVDPELPHKAAAGRFDEIEPCTECRTCHTSMQNKGDMRCAVNAEFCTDRPARIAVTRNGIHSADLTADPAIPRTSQTARIRRRPTHGTERHRRKPLPQILPAEFKRRHDLLYRLMDEQDIDLAIVYTGYSRMYQQTSRWLTGMRESMQAYAVFPRHGEPTTWNSLYPHLICAQRVSALKDTRWGGPSIAKTVVNRIRELGLDKGRLGLIGVHADRGITLPMDHYLIFKEEMPQAEMVNITRDVEDLGMVRSEEELTFYARGAEYTDYTMAELIKAVKPGASETQLYGRVMTAAWESGGEPEFALLGSTSHDRARHALSRGTSRRSG